MSCPANYDFCLSQGSDKTLPLVLKSGGEPLDLRGYKAAMQLRRSAESKTAIDTLTTENGMISIDEQAGRVSILFAHEKTENYPACVLVYDLEMISAEGQITRVLQGEIEVLREVTRIDRQTL